MSRPCLVSPIDHASEAEALLQAGADELYGGLVPAGWQEKFGLLGSLNQRTFSQAQLSSLEELEQVVDAARRYDKPFSLTLNAPFYSLNQYPLIEQLVAQAAEIGVAGLILADPGLLQKLKAEFPGFEYHISTLAHAGNVESLRFFRGLGADRAVIPRHIDTGSVATMSRSLPGMKLDAFILVGKCPNTEGLCTFHHSSQDRIWPCEIPYEIVPREKEESPLLEKARKRQLSWSQTNRRHGCGLCAIPALIQAGIHGFKLVGRGASTSMKVSNLKLVGAFLDKALAGIDAQAYFAEARKAHHNRFGSPCSANVCYYPEFFGGE